jgi:hypothetical protein
MNFSLIPWSEFLETLQQQQPKSRQFWLRRWMFTNEGAMLADHRAANSNWMRALWSTKPKRALDLEHASAPNES